MKPPARAGSLVVGAALLACWSAACGSDTPPNGGPAGASGMAGGSGSGAGAAPVAGKGGASGTGGHAAGATSGGGGMGTAGSAGSGGSNSGGGGQGGGGGGATAVCANPSYKMCEDFEGAEAGSLPTGWTQHVGYGTASAQDQTVSTERFRGGAKALKSVSGQKGISRIQKSLEALGATADKHWGRIFYSVQTPAPTHTAHLHITFVGLMGATENRVVDTVQEPGGNVHQWLFNNPDDQGGVATTYDWTFDAEWHCAEWYVDVGTKSYRFFHDSEEVTALAFTGKQDSQMSSYTSLIVGATHYQDTALTPPFVVWFDDLAVADMQVGCE